MRKLFHALVDLVWVNGAFAADRPWLQIMVPSTVEAAASFDAPPPENGISR